MSRIMKKKILIKILLLLSFFYSCRCDYKSKYKEALNKAKSFYKSHIKKDKTWHFLGYDQSEYPGRNEKYKKLHKEKWEEYYKCLNMQNNMLGEHGSVIPEAVQGFEGHSISFDCKICISPKERSNIDLVEWHWTSFENEQLVQVEYTEHILITPEDKTLSLYNLQLDQTGLYVCKLGTALTAPYYLTVINSTTNIAEVHTKFAIKAPYPKNIQTIEEYNLVLDTVWGEWSPCSVCHNVGKRHKFGYCIVRMGEEEIISPSIEIATNTIVKNENKKSTRENQKELAEDLELLKIFENGIPCMSHILSRSMKNLINKQNRTNEVMVGYCKVSCPEESVFEVRDQQGNVIETANNSAGIYSMVQGLPPIEPPVQRMLQYKKTAENIIVSCPGNLNSDTPITWQIGSKKLIPELISQQSNKRIFISVSDKIHIQKAKISDSNIYSCWQNNELAGTVRLIVEKQIKLSFNHHIMLFGMVIILGTFLYIFAKAVFGHKYTKYTQ